MITTCDNNNPLSSATDANSLPQGWWCAARQRLWCRCAGGFASKLVGCRHLYGAEPWLFLGRPPTQTPSYHVLSIHSLRWICIINLLVWCFFSYFGNFWDVYGCVWTSCVSQRSTVVPRGSGLVPGRPTTTSLPSCPSRAPSTACGTSPDTQRPTGGENIGKHRKNMQQLATTYEKTVTKHVSFAAFDSGAAECSRI